MGDVPGSKESNLKVGDLVKLQKHATNQEMLNEFGYGLIEDVYEYAGNVQVLFLKNKTSRTMNQAYLEMVSEI